MKRYVYIVGIILVGCAVAKGQLTKTENLTCSTTLEQPIKKVKVRKQEQSIDLVKAVEAVKEALDCYQTNVNASGAFKDLPDLASVQLDFKATTAHSGGVSLSILVLKFGGSKETDVTDDVTLTYQPHKTTTETAKGKGYTNNTNFKTTLYSDLVKEVVAAANAAKVQNSLLKLPLDEFKVTVSYGIKYDVSAGVTVPIQLVTIAGNGDYNRNNIQTVALTFTPQHH